MKTRSRFSVGSLALFGAVAVAVTSASCSMDPVHAAAVNALGPEVAGVPQGEYHRAGQPCAVCHGPEGPAKTTFTVAGTVFYGPTKAIGVDNVQVIMADWKSSFTAYTDCVGNFFVTSDQWNPDFPIEVQIAKDNGGPVRMLSHIGREPSCGNCHKDPPYYDSQGHIHLVTQAVEDMNQYSPPPCPVNPVQTSGGGM